MYSIDSQLPTFYMRNADNVVTLPVYVSGMAVTAPSSGTFTLYDQSKIAISTGAVTVTGGIATYTVPSASLPTTLSLSWWWQEEWTLTFGDGHVEIFRRDAYLCLRLLHPVVTEPMLVRRVADLQNLRPPTLTTWQTYIDEAWGTINRYLLQEGKRPYLAMNDYAFTEWHLAMTLGLIFRDLSTYMSDGRYKERADAYDKQAEDARDAIRLEYDMVEANQRVAASPSIPARPVVYGNFAPAMAYRRWSGPPRGGWR